MPHKLFAPFAAFSLVLCGITTVLQLRGYFFLGDSLGIWRFEPTGIISPDGSDRAMPWTFTPLFAITILSLLPPIFATRTLAEFAKERRLRRGSCATGTCSLPANTTGLCPECGTPFRSIAKSRLPIAK